MSKELSTKIDACITEILDKQEKQNAEIVKLNAVIRNAQIKKDELRRKNDSIVAETCKKYELKQYHINMVLKAQKKGAIEENE